MIVKLGEFLWWGNGGVFQQEILQFCSTKGSKCIFLCFPFFRAYISWWNERELYNGKWKKRSYQREETRRKGCEIHIKKYIEYNTKWPKNFNKSRICLLSISIFSPCNDLTRFFFFLSIFKINYVVPTCAVAKKISNAISKRFWPHCAASNFIIVVVCNFLFVVVFKDQKSSFPCVVVYSSSIGYQMNS